MPDNQLLLAIFSAIESAHFYSAFLPSVFTIQTFVQDGIGREAIRRGEVYASLLAITMSYVVARLSKSRLPLVFGGFMAFLMIGVYESSLRQTKTGLAVSPVPSQSEVDRYSNT